MFLQVAVEGCWSLVIITPKHFYKLWIHSNKDIVCVCVGGRVHVCVCVCATYCVRTFLGWYLCDYLSSCTADCTRNQGSFS